MKICQMEEFGIPIWQIALFFIIPSLDLSEASLAIIFEHIQGPVLPHWGPVLVQTGGPVLSHPGTSTFTSGNSIYENTGPRCESTGPWMWKYWSPDVEVVPGCAQIMNGEALDRPRKGIMKKLEFFGALR